MTGWKQSKSTQENGACDMTDKDMEIQALRRKVESLERENKKLEQIHQLDMAEIAYQRRQIDFLMEASREP